MLLGFNSKLTALWRFWGWFWREKWHLNTPQRSEEDEKSPNSWKEWYSRKADESATILAMTKNKLLAKKTFLTKFWITTLFGIEPLLLTVNYYSTMQQSFQVILSQSNPNDFYSFKRLLLPIYMGFFCVLRYKRQWHRK